MSSHSAAGDYGGGAHDAHLGDPARAKGAEPAGGVEVLSGLRRDAGTHRRPGQQQVHRRGQVRIVRQVIQRLCADHRQLVDPPRHREQFEQLEPGRRRAATARRGSPA